MAILKLEATGATSGRSGSRGCIGDRSLGLRWRGSGLSGCCRSVASRGFIPSSRILSEIDQLSSVSDGASGVSRARSKGAERCIATKGNGARTTNSHSSNKDLLVRSLKLALEKAAKFGIPGCLLTVRHGDGIRLERQRLEKCDELKACGLTVLRGC